jgi:hypothetical protein
VSITGRGAICRGDESAGCINVSPEDCKWIFRWSQPLVEYDPGEKTVTDYSGTTVIVRQS